MRGVILAVTGVAVIIAMASLVLMQQTESVSGLQYQRSVVDEAALRRRRVAALQPSVHAGDGVQAPKEAISPVPHTSSTQVGSESPRPSEEPAPRAACAAALDRPFLEAVWSDQREVIVTFANAGGLDMALNVWANARAGGVRHVAMAGMDVGALEGLAAAGVPCFPMRDAATSKAEKIGWGGAAFRNLGVRKITLLIDLLELGADVVLMDADTVLLQDPLPFLRRWPDADILASTDHLVNSTATHGLEALHAAHSHWNIGFFFIRSRARHFAHAWRDLQIRKPHWWDQHSFGFLLRQGVNGNGTVRGNGGPNGLGWDLTGDKSGLSDPLLFRAFTNASLVVGTLSVVKFGNGHTSFVQRLPWKFGVAPYFVHATHQYSGSPGKRHRIREAGFWHDPPAHYDPPGGLLYAPLHLPDSVLRPTSPEGKPLFSMQRDFLDKTYNHSQHPSLLAHFNLAHVQVRHIRDAVALAWLTGRKLVLPPLACGFDRGPFPSMGKSGETTYQDLPMYPCPLDYVFDLDRKSSGPFPALLEVAREYSLLNNSRMPREVLASTLRLGALPPGSTGESLKQDWASHKLVELGQVPPAFGPGSLLSEEQQQNYKRSLQGFTDVWCCVEPPRWGEAGHILYDALFDLVPHKDRFNREWTCPWHIVVGHKPPRC